MISELEKSKMEAEVSRKKEADIDKASQDKASQDKASQDKLLQDKITKDNLIKEKLNKINNDIRNLHNSAKGIIDKKELLNTVNQIKELIKSKSVTRIKNIKLTRGE